MFGINEIILIHLKFCTKLVQLKFKFIEIICRLAIEKLNIYNNFHGYILTQSSFATKGQTTSLGK